MDTKIIIETVCPHCGSKMSLKISKVPFSHTLKCPVPSCTKPFMLKVDENRQVETSKLKSSDSSTTTKKRDTIYRKDEDLLNSKQQSSNNQNANNGSRGQNGNRSSEDNNKSEESRSTRRYRRSEDNGHDGYQSHDKPQYDWDDDSRLDRDNKRKHKRERLLRNVYLTRVRFFGLKKDRYQLFEGTTIIGRYDEEEQSDIAIQGDDTMSRRSVSITISDEGYGLEYTLKVLNATNKVQVNNQTLRERETIALESGDTIFMGSTKFLFEIE